VFFATREMRLLLASILLHASTAVGGEIRVVVSGGFTALYQGVVPENEHATQNEVMTSHGASMGGAAEFIPIRREREEPAEVAIMASDAWNRKPCSIILLAANISQPDHHSSQSLIYLPPVTLSRSSQYSVSG
jgi:hypothetical protein